MKKLIILATTILFMTGYMANAQMMGKYGHGWGMGWWWIIGLILVIAAVWIVVKSMNPNSDSGQKTGKSALDILKERYARGEIYKKEFEERKKNLM